jgi:hypothetical protein
VATNKDFIVKNGLSVGEDISVSGSVTSNLQFDDSVQLQLGTDSDLLIYHDNSNAYIDDVGAGSLYIRSGTTYFQNAAGTKTSIQTNSGAGQTLYFNNDPIFATLVDGVSVTGNAVLTGELRGPASFVIDPATVGDNTGAVVIKGDLTVEGTTTTINSTTLDVADKNITLNFGAGDTSATANNAGITVQDAIDTGSSTTDATMLWNQLDERFDFSHPIAAGRFSRLGLAGHESIFTHSTTNNSAIICSGSDNIEIRGRLSDNYQIYAKSGGNVGIGKIPGSVKLDVAGDIASSGTITGSDFSGITMGGSLSGSHDDAKVQYGTAFVGTAAQGHFFFDSLNQKLKVYTGSAFVDAVPAGGGGGGGSGSSDATATFRKYTYTLTGTTNAISGKEDDEVTTGDFISGRLYEITVVGNTDFTAIGASSNAIGVQFTATDVGGGTTGKAKEVLFYATGGTQNIEVYVNGVKAVEGSSNDYVATTGTSVTFTSNLSSGDVVDIQVYELLTNDSFYLKTETYTQAEVNSQIATGTASYLPLVGGSLTGNLTVEKSANPTLTVTETGAGAVTIQGTGSGGRVYSNASNKLLLGANGQNAHIIVNTTGTVGIGAGTNPTSKLQVEGSMGTTPLVLMKSADTTANDGAVLKLDASGRGSGIVDIDIFAVHNYDGGVFHIRNNGFVGIGTDDPDQPLHVKGTRPVRLERAGVGEFEITIDNVVTGDSLDFVVEPVSGSVSAGFQVRTRQTDGTLLSSFSVNHDGKVGIGTIEPEGGLHLHNYGSQYAELILERDSTGVEAKFDIKPYAGSLYIREYTTSGDNSTTDIIQITDTGHFLPISTSQDIGSTTKPWRNIYTQDLVLSNEKREIGNDIDGTKGNWTIQEGEEHLYIINNKSGKKYKFALEEIE